MSFIFNAWIQCSIKSTYLDYIIRCIKRLSYVWILWEQPKCWSVNYNTLCFCFIIHFIYVKNYDCYLSLLLISYGSNITMPISRCILYIFSTTANRYLVVRIICMVGTVTHRFRMFFSDYRCSKCHLSYSADWCVTMFQLQNSLFYKMEDLLSHSSEGTPPWHNLPI